MERLAEFAAILRKGRTDGHTEPQILSALHAAGADFLTLADVQKICAAMSLLDRQLERGFIELARRED